MTQKITNSNIDKNTEKEVEELFYSESNMKYLEKLLQILNQENQN